MLLAADVEFLQLARDWDVERHRCIPRSFGKTCLYLRPSCSCFSIYLQGRVAECAPVVWPDRMLDPAEASEGQATERHSDTTIRCHCGGPAPGPGRKLEVQSRQNEAGEQDEEMSFNEMEISSCGLAGSRPRLEASAVEFRKTRHMVNVGGNA